MATHYYTKQKTNFIESNAHNQEMQKSKSLTPHVVKQHKKNSVIQIECGNATPGIGPM